MRPTWSGTLTFGLVAIPVAMHSAVRSKERISFRMLHKSDLSPIKYDRVCELEGESVPWKEIVKGYEYKKGKYIVLDEDDFRAAAVESSKMIEILGFVDETEIDARYFETPYYLIPGTAAEKPYALLREAMRETGKVGIGKVTLRTNSYHLVTIRTVGDAMMLEIMRFADELVDPTTFEFPDQSAVRPQELKMAEQLVENLSEPFDASKYHDEYHDNLKKIIKDKMKGKTIEYDEPEAPEATPVLDLMTRLQQSLEQGKKAKRARGASGASSTTGAKRTRTKAASGDGGRKSATRRRKSA
jgi:DNA end-binding protein Ku